MLEREPKVYVTQENPALNYAAAESFGEVVFLTAEDFSPVKNSLLNVQLMSDIQNRLREFDPNVDYIVVSGSPVTAAAVFMILGSAKNNALNMLRWSNRDHTYQLQHININRTK